jgi:putative flavoprotein involved in K+ transport
LFRYGRNSFEKFFSPYKMETKSKTWHTIIIGAGQAGLATGYYLKKLNKEFMILDENGRIGDVWRKRWDSLLLFTPAQYDGLPGMPFPAEKDSFPGKEAMADYLENYSDQFSLPVKLNTRVNHVVLRDAHYEILTSGGNFQTERVVIATGTNPKAYIPSFASELAPEIFQMHSSAYHNPASLPEGDVLVVGSATSGIEIAVEVAATRRTYISGTPPFRIPDNVFTYGGRFAWWFLNNLVTLKTPIGRKAKQKILKEGSPLIRVSADDLSKSGVYRLPRLIRADDGWPYFEDNSVIRVSTVIWATGYKPDFSWIDAGQTFNSAWPDTRRGVLKSCNGLYFVGMPFQFGLTSGLIGGVGRDAAYIARAIGNSNHADTRV